MASEIIYDLCVIGAGMFGSAAARHASANVSLKTCLIGPSEPTAEERPNREVFGAHYDEGRITRVLDAQPACQILSKHSINRFKELEKLSGISFHAPVGCLFIGKKNGEYMLKCNETAGISNVPLAELSNEEIFQQRYPYLKLEKEYYALLDDNGAGHISPRKIVSAQKKVAQLQGCDIIDSVVCSADTLPDGIHVVKTSDKKTIKAKRLLIATGAFTNAIGLNVLKPFKLTARKETVLMLNVTKDEADRLSSMPSVIFVKENKRTPKKIGVYVLPPIKYPNGQYYIKFGKSQAEEDEVETLEELKKWYLSDGDEKIKDTHFKIVLELIKDLNIKDMSRKTCATCDTPSGLPYIDRITPTITVAIGGNGKGAKLSDEVGRIAAHLSTTGQWNSELSQNLFQSIFQ